MTRLHTRLSCISCGIAGAPRRSEHGILLWNCGAAQCRQIHPVQCPDRGGIDAQNYPFCTIDPNVGIVPVPDPRLDQLADITQPKKIVPTTMEFVDIAGLVAGASRGEGLGNKFLAHIRETDAIAHVVRCFEDSDVVHVEGRVDPVADVASSIPNCSWLTWRRWSASNRKPKRSAAPATRMRRAVCSCLTRLQAGAGCTRRPARAGSERRPSRPSCTHEPADPQTGDVHRQCRLKPACAIIRLLDRLREHVAGRRRRGGAGVRGSRIRAGRPGAGRAGGVPGRAGS